MFLYQTVHEISLSDMTVKIHDIAKLYIAHIYSPVYAQNRSWRSNSRQRRLIAVYTCVIMCRQGVQLKTFLYFVTAPCTGIVKPVSRTQTHITKDTVCSQVCPRPPRQAV